MDNPVLIVMPTATPSSLSNHPANFQPQIFWKADAQGHLIYLAPQWQAVTGQSATASLGDRYLECIHPDDRHLGLDSQSLAQPYAAALRLRLLDGTYAKWIAQAQPITDANQQILEWLGAFTLAQPQPSALQFNAELELCVAQRTAEMEGSMIRVRDYVERVTVALDAAKMGMWDWDLITNQTVWSPYHEMLLGYESGTPRRTYQDWAERVHPDDLAWVEAEMEHCRRSGSDYNPEYRVIWPDGSQHWLTAFGRFHYNPAGQPIRMVGMIWDISDRKQAELKLIETQERFQATFEQAAVGIAHVALNGQWLRVNQKLCEIVGYSHAELLALTFQDITHPEDLAADLACIQRLLSDEINTYVLEKRYLRQDQTVVWVNLTVSLVRQAQNSAEPGAPKYFISVIEDIGDRKAAELTLQNRSRELNQLNLLFAQTTALVEKRNQELDQFAYLVSHDLKAPLRAISNLAHWIEDDLGRQLPPENQQHLQLMQSRVGRMEKLINGLLEYSRIGRVNMEIQPVAVADLLAEVIDSIDPPATFKIQIAADLPTLKTKRLLLHQVFSNLISNAIKHHDRPDGQIQISAQPQPNGYEFAVGDDGPGIAANQHERIFGIFQTLHQSKDENTGIGLAIVKKIVESEAGQISVESSLGEGTTFRFTWSAS
ncbi:MAG: PAS domain-containing protein [Aphanocapsa sp. GSE-SYN-MK-11-07L]|jgi:PAS domain S-box-containing protein|nr:PAS domain-containing protein [Aphanocapsa sp. GSE-SYN-MK-11-07L]